MIDLIKFYNDYPLVFMGILVYAVAFLALVYSQE